jgi:hypothetical protein
MPLSNANKRVLHEPQRKDEEKLQKKRRLSDQNSSATKRSKVSPTDSPTMTDSQKRANFSALPSPGSNGVHRHASPLNSSKPGTTKKLVIKNLKGTGKLMLFVNF